MYTSHSRLTHFTLGTASLCLLLATLAPKAGHAQYYERRMQICNAAIERHKELLKNYDIVRSNPILNGGSEEFKKAKADHDTFKIGAHAKAVADEKQAKLKVEERERFNRTDMFARDLLGLHDKSIALTAKSDAFKVQLTSLRAEQKSMRDTLMSMKTSLSNNKLGLNKKLAGDFTALLTKMKDAYWDVRYDEYALVTKRINGQDTLVRGNVVRTWTDRGDKLYDAARLDAIRSALTLLEIDGKREAGANIVAQFESLAFNNGRNMVPTCYRYVRGAQHFETCKQATDWGNTQGKHTAFATEAKALYDAKVTAYDGLGIAINNKRAELTSLVSSIDELAGQNGLAQRELRAVKLEINEYRKLGWTVRELLGELEDARQALLEKQTLLREAEATLSELNSAVIRAQIRDDKRRAELETQLRQIRSGYGVFCGGGGSFRGNGWTITGELLAEYTCYNLFTPQCNAIRR